MICEKCKLQPAVAVEIIDGEPDVPLCSACLYQSDMEAALLGMGIEAHKTGGIN